MRNIMCGKLGGGQPWVKVWLEVLMSPSSGAGTSFAEMRATVPLVEKLEAVSDDAESILLEDAEWQLLKDRIESHMSWTGNRREILDLCEAVTEAGVYNINAAAGGERHPIPDEFKAAR